MRFKSKAAVSAATIILAGCSVTPTVNQTTDLQPSDQAMVSAPSGTAKFNLQSKPAVKGVLPPEAKDTLSQLNADWWRWSLSIPFDETHPLSQTGEVDLSAYQPEQGNVWFLGGAFTSGTFEREGTVPTGTALFIPLINRSYLEDARVANGELPTPFPGDTIPYPLTLETYRSLIPFFDAAGNPTVSNLSFTLDGNTANQADLLPYYSESPIFEFDLLPGTRFAELCAVEDPVELIPGLGEVNNCWRVDTERLQAFANGYYVYVNPLPPGEHTLRFTAQRGSFSLDVTYHLTVVARN